MLKSAQSLPTRQNKNILFFFVYLTGEETPGKKTIFLCILALWLVLPRVNAEGEVLRWVEFDLSYSALKAALEQDIAAQGEEKPISWIDILALASVRKGAKLVDAKAVRQAAQELKGDQTPQELLGEQYT